MIRFQEKVLYRNNICTAEKLYVLKCRGYFCYPFQLLLIQRIMLYSVFLGGTFLFHEIYTSL